MLTANYDEPMRQRSMRQCVPWESCTLVTQFMWFFAWFYNSVWVYWNAWVVLRESSVCILSYQLAIFTFPSRSLLWIERRILVWTVILAIDLSSVHVQDFDRIPHYCLVLSYKELDQACTVSTTSLSLLLSIYQGSCKGHLLQWRKLPGWWNYWY